MPIANLSGDGTLLGRKITLETDEYEILIKALDNGENATDLFEYDKYPPHLSEVERQLHIESRIPLATPIYSGVVISITRIDGQIDKGYPINVGDTIAFEDENRIATGP